MIQFYCHPTPNPSKVALFLEEAGLSYTLMPVDISRGEQHTASFRAINPNAKVPALVDDGIAIFDSSAILLYLARLIHLFSQKVFP
jgi:GSH-dependent disulfide-bond oxidoreductase